MSQTRSTPKILLVGWELADWKLLHPLLDAGYLPNLEQLINRGVIADLSAGTWRTMATGQPAAPEGGACLWDVFASAGRRCLVVRWPGSHPAALLPAGGVFISDEFNRPERPDAPPGPAIEPANLVQTMDAMRVDFTSLELNEIRAFVPALDQLGEEDRPVISWLAQALADVATTQKTAVYLLENEPWDLAMIHYGALGAISRQFLALSQKPGGAYGGVPTGAVILADKMLGRVLELAGIGTTTCVCSAYGLFGNAAAVLAGPGIRADERLEERGGTPASVLDIAPTLCNLAGLPALEGAAGGVWNVRLDPA